MSTSPSNVSSDELKRKCAWSAAAHLGGKDISLWMAAYPSGFQPYRNSQFNYDEWVAAGYDRAFIEDYLVVERSTATTTRTRPTSRASRASSSTTRGPRTSSSRAWAPAPRAQEIADAIAAGWEEITDQIGRDSQLELYRASLGL